jgi:hypothetical protein
MTGEERERLERARSTVEELEWKPAPLWRLFREASCEGGECRDIVEKHVMSKLNGTDVKFFYEVNTETRALIKRSTRTGELGLAFKVSVMSSISTLEIVWENRSLWKHWVNEKKFCAQVARTNKLELLKWIREVKKCEWDEWTISAAPEQGNLEMVKYCVANKCPADEYACAKAASHGHLECLKYLHEEVKAPWNSNTAAFAAENGHLHILEYLVERKYDKFSANSCASAASNGHLDCLKYLREVAKAPWDWQTANVTAGSGHLHILEYLVERKYDKFREFACVNAVMHGHLDCLKYLHEVAEAPWGYLAVARARFDNQSECLRYLLYNGCPLPEGWRYEHETLRVPQQDA